MDLSDRWPLPDAFDVRDELLAAYSDPSRGYHDTRHLTEVLDRLDELAGAQTSFAARNVALAAWFHDGVYDGERDAEDRSAFWAEDVLTGVLPEADVAEVARLVRLTETHEPDDADDNGCALSDADLAILAAPATRYAEYVTQVRAEYAHVSDEDFRTGRSAVLQHLAEKPHLFHTAYARERWETAARANLERELGGLTSS